MTIHKIMVIGAGIMGSGIAQACIEGGFETLLIDATIELAESGSQKINHFLQRKVDKAKKT